jgi:hypothetical protein
MLQQVAQQEFQLLHIDRQQLVLASAEYQSAL